ncbi:hypothetical protein CCAL5182_08860, partial [Campylobacter sp. 7477a]|nr:hypothetical protein [Campylobacter sp. 7477a]
MWVNSKVAAEILGIEYEKLKKATQRANKVGKNFCSLGCHICHFNYTNGVGRGGKVLQIWLDDEKFNKSYKTDKNIEVNNEEISDTDTTMVNTNSISSTELATSVDTRYDECFDLENVRDSELMGDKDIFASTKNSLKQIVKNEPQTPINIKIKDLENMNKVKAVTELNACPKGMSKTLWGKGVSQKYGVSLKTLYAWAKEQKIDEVQVSDDELSIDFKASFKSSSFEMSALEWAVGFMLHNPLSSKTFTMW